MSFLSPVCPYVQLKYQINPISDRKRELRGNSTTILQVKVFGCDHDFDQLDGGGDDDDDYGDGDDDDDVDYDDADDDYADDDVTIVQSET